MLELGVASALFELVKRWKSTHIKVSQHGGENYSPKSHPLGDDGVRYVRSRIRRGDVVTPWRAPGNGGLCQ